MSRSPNGALSVVLSVARQPFVDLHIAGLRLLGSLATLPWCQAQLVASAGFIEYLLDRSTEHGERAGLDAKYDIVSKLAGSESAAGIMSSEVLIRLREYVREGPIYVKVEAQVAFEKAE